MSPHPEPAPESQTPVGDLSYEQARDELVSVVARLEAGAETLEGSLQLWERGEALAARCQQWLDGARERLREVQPPVRSGTEPAPRAPATPDPGPAPQTSDVTDAPEEQDAR